MDDQVFAFEFETRYRLAGRVFGIRPQTTAILVDDTSVRARFGPWRVRTPLSNVASIAITGPYAFIKTAGRAHLGITDRGLTFATNSQAGVWLEFHTPITGIDPIGLIRHPNLTLTPSDVDGLAAALSA